jgi:hypothetical protein
VCVFVCSSYICTCIIVSIYLPLLIFSKWLLVFVGEPLEGSVIPIGERTLCCQIIHIAILHITYILHNKNSYMHVCRIVKFLNESNQIIDATQKKNKNKKKLKNNACTQLQKKKKERRIAIYTVFVGGLWRGMDVNSLSN